MKSRHVFFGMIALVVLMALGIFLSLAQANKILNKRSEKLIALKLDNRVLEEQEIALTKAATDVEKYTGLENIAKAIVPQDKDQAEAVREIVKIANETNVKLTSISFPTSTLGQAKAVVATDTTNPQPVKPSISQVKAVETIPGVYVMEVNIQQDTNQPVTYGRMIDFLSRLERNRRTAQVTNVTVQPNPQNRSLLTFSLIVNIYIKP
ncbi:MAG TPA: hypothetical protein VJJ78_02090 [Candidatus Saccharimonadales bacterium]|nr:hypothetical protein [Candidatus Saccharimonadales bacterium]